MKRDEWKKYGDVNFLTYGGSLVRKAWDEETVKKYPILGDEYDVLCISEIPEQEDKVLAYIKRITPSDFSGKIDSMVNTFNFDPDTVDPDYFAVLCAEYIGLEPQMDGAYRSNGMYPANEDYIISREDARKWLEQLEVPEEMIGEEEGERNVSMERF